MTTISIHCGQAVGVTHCIHLTKEHVEAAFERSSYHSDSLSDITLPITWQREIGKGKN